MAAIGRTVIALLAQRLQSSIGVNSALAVLRGPARSSPADIRLFTLRNVAPELMEKSNQALYPNILIYCEKLNNSLIEKFRIFSGVARLVVELRTSEDRLEALDSTLVYTDVICGVLDNSRGEWIPGIFYGGGYEVVYLPVRLGGKHFLQSAKISFEVNVSE